MLSAQVISWFSRTLVPPGELEIHLIIHCTSKKKPTRTKQCSVFWWQYQGVSLLVPYLHWGRWTNPGSHKTTILHSIKVYICVAELARIGVGPFSFQVCSYKIKKQTRTERVPFPILGVLFACLVTTLKVFHVVVCVGAVISGTRNPVPCHDLHWQIKAVTVLHTYPYVTWSMMAHLTSAWRLLLKMLVLATSYTDCSVSLTMAGIVCIIFLFKDPVAVLWSRSWVVSL